MYRAKRTFTSWPIISKPHLPLSYGRKRIISASTPIPFSCCTHESRLLKSAGLNREKSQLSLLVPSNGKTLIFSGPFIYLSLYGGTAKKRALLNALAVNVSTVCFFVSASWNGHS